MVRRAVPASDATMVWASRFMARGSPSLSRTVAGPRAGRLSKVHPSPPPPPAPGAPTPPWPPIPVAVVAPAGPPPRCAWEDAPGLTTWFETARAVLGSPRQTFRGVAPRNGLGLPMLFWLCGTVAGMIGAGSWRLLRMYQVGRLDDMSAAQTFGIVAIAFALALAFV